MSVSRADECRARAAENEFLARLMSLENDRNYFQELARDWNRLADAAEREVPTPAALPE